MSAQPRLSRLAMTLATAASVVALVGSGVAIAQVETTSPSTPPPTTAPTESDAPLDRPATTPSSTMPPRPTTETGAPSPEGREVRTSPAACQDFHNVSQNQWHTLCGRILDKYHQLGGAGGFLGSPTSGELVNPDGVGRRTSFQNDSSIYWHPDADAHQIGGEIGARWAETGWEGGLLGYPTTDEITNPDGVGNRNWFQGGAIYWHPQSGAWPVWGEILKNWGSRGYEVGRFGYPTSGEFDFAGGKAQNFNQRTIDWRPGDPETPADYVPPPGERRFAQLDTSPIDPTAQTEADADTGVGVQQSESEYPFYIEDNDIPDQIIYCGVWSSYVHNSMARQDGLRRFPGEIHTQTRTGCNPVTTGIVEQRVESWTSRLRWWGVPEVLPQQPFPGKTLSSDGLRAVRPQFGPDARMAQIVSAVQCTLGTYFRYRTDARGTIVFSDGFTTSRTAYEENDTEIPCLSDP